MLVSLVWNPIPTYKEAALTVTRYSSQVCRGWHQLLMESPDIWATSLDLQCLNQQGDEWKNEAFRRMGDNCLLIVIGELNKYWPSSRFLTFLLENHWTRIRRLFVQDLGSSPGSGINKAFKKAAPNLEILAFVDGSGHCCKVLQDGVPLFANCAHQLCDIESHPFFF